MIQAPLKIDLQLLMLEAIQELVQIPVAPLQRSIIDVSLAGTDV